MASCMYFSVYKTLPLCLLVHYFSSTYHSVLEKLRKLTFILSSPTLTESQSSIYWSTDFSVVQSVRLFAIPWTAVHQASVSFTITQKLLKLMSTESVDSSNHLVLCCPLILLPLIFPSITHFQQFKSMGSSWIFLPFEIHASTVIYL